MTKLWPMIAAIVLSSSPGSTMPPPLLFPIVVISNDESAQTVGEAFVTVLRERSWLSPTGTLMKRDQFYSCLQETRDQAKCIRDLSTWKNKGAAVVVLVSGSPNQKWECIGIAATAKYLNRQIISVQLQQGIFGSSNEQKIEQEKASGCIIAAAAESGW